VNFQGTGDEVRGRLAVRMAAGTAQGDVTYFPKRKAYDGQIQATGQSASINFRALSSGENIQVVGTLNLTAKGSGTVDDPSVGIHSAGTPSFRFQDQTINRRETSGRMLQIASATFKPGLGGAETHLYAARAK